MTDPKDNKEIITKNSKNTEEIIVSFEKKLSLFIEAQRKENIKEYSTEHLEFENEKSRTDLINFWAIRDLINYEGKDYNPHGKFRVKRKNFLTNEELEWAEKELNRLENELEIYSSDSEDEEDEELAVSTIQGKEVIKAEISQELTKIKETFEKLEFSPISITKSKEALKEKLLELHERRGCEAEIDLMTGASAFTGRQETVKLRKEKADVVAEALSKTAMELVNNAISDLDYQKKKANKRMGQLIVKREEEVAEARKAITQMESIITRLSNEKEDAEKKSEDLEEKLQETERQAEEKIKNSQENSDEEIKVLQESIRKLNNQLEEIRKREEKLKAQREEQIRKKIAYALVNSEKTETTMKRSPEEEIEALKNELNETLFSANFFKEAEAQRKLELDDLKDTLEAEKTRLNNEISRTKKELENLITNKDKEIERKKAEIQRKEEQIQINDQEWKKNYDLEMEMRKKAEVEKKKLEKELEEKEEELEQQQPTINRLRIEKEALQTELNQTKQERQEIKTKYEVLTQKSWFYQACDKVGLVSLKNSIANISTIGGMVFFLFVVSWMWKNMIIPTFRNFKGEPTPKNPQPQPAPTQSIYPHQPIKEVRIETVKQLPEEVMDVKASPAESKPVEVNANSEEENFSKETEEKPVKKVKKKRGKKKTEEKKKLKDS